MNARPVGLLAGLSVMLFSAASFAQVPSFLNYQGKLIKPDGSPETNSVAIKVRLYTERTNSMPVYVENIGLVPVQEGIYSFSWGGGTSVWSTTEIMGEADGTRTSFSHTVGHFPMLNPSVTIMDGTYTWSDASGSSDPVNFVGIAIHSTGFVSAVYPVNPPISGTELSVAYTYTQDGVLSVLQGYGNVWVEVDVNGEPLDPRHQLVAVPYALMAKESETDRAILGPFSEVVGADTDRTMSGSIPIMPMDGDVVGILAKVLNGSVTTGTISTEVAVNGVLSGFSTTIDSSNAVMNSSLASPREVPFTAGDEISVRIITSSDLAPTSLNIRVTLVVSIH